MSPMRVAHSVKLSAVHRRQKAVLSESTRDKNEVRVWLLVRVEKCPAVIMNKRTVFHNNYS